MKEFNIKVTSADPLTDNASDATIKITHDCMIKILVAQCGTKYWTFE